MRVCLAKFGTDIVGFLQVLGDVERRCIVGSPQAWGTSALLDSSHQVPTVSLLIMTARPLHLYRPLGAQAPPLRPGRWGVDTREGGLASLVGRSQNLQVELQSFQASGEEEVGSLGEPSLSPLPPPGSVPQSRVYPQSKGAPIPALDLPHMQSLWHWLGAASAPGRFAGLWGQINFPLPPCSPPLSPAPPVNQPPAPQPPENRKQRHPEQKTGSQAWGWRVRRQCSFAYHWMTMPWEWPLQPGLLGPHPPTPMGDKGWGQELAIPFQVRGRCGNMTGASAQPPHPSKADRAFSVQGTPLSTPPGCTSWELRVHMCRSVDGF